MGDMVIGFLISFVLTAISYMAFPVIRLLINQGKFEKKKAKRIALWNSIILGAFFCILTAALSEGNVTWSGGAAMLYYWINCALLTDNGAEMLDGRLAKEASSQRGKNDLEVVLSTERKSLLGDNIVTSISSNDETKTRGETSTELIKENSKAQITQPILFCRKCGNKLPEGSVFCNKCGTRIYGL